MSEMIERVARALYAQDSTQAEVAGYKLASVWEYEPKRHDAYFKLARAAIEAMREPDEAMIDKAWAMITSNLRYEEVYRHMIDAALKPKRED